MPWFVYSFFVAVSWGLLYVMVEMLIRRGISPLSVVYVAQPVYFISLVFLFFFNKKIVKDFKSIITNWELLSITIGISVAAIFANWCIGQATKLSNASMASMIEISYPLFVALFSYFIFENFSFKWEYWLGFGLISIGSGIIILK